MLVVFHFHWSWIAKFSSSWIWQLSSNSFGDWAVESMDILAQNFSASRLSIIINKIKIKINKWLFKGVNPKYRHPKYGHPKYRNPKYRHTQNTDTQNTDTIFYFFLFLFLFYFYFIFIFIDKNYMAVNFFGPQIAFFRLVYFDNERDSTSLI